MRNGCRLKRTPPHSLLSPLSVLVSVCRCRVGRTGHDSPKRNGNGRRTGWPSPKVRQFRGFKSAAACMSRGSPGIRDWSTIGSRFWTPSALATAESEFYSVIWRYVLWAFRRGFPRVLFSSERREGSEFIGGTAANVWPVDDGSRDYSGVTHFTCMQMPRNVNISTKYRRR